MDRSHLIKCLNQMDFKVNRQGVVKNSGGKTFGLVRNYDIRTMNGENVPFLDLATMSFDEATNTMTLTDADGNVIGQLSGVDEEVDDSVITLSQMPATDSELNDVFQILYPDSYDKLYYDVLDEREMVDLSLFDQEGGIQPLNDNIENIYLDHIERRLRAEGFMGKIPSVEVRRRVLSLQIHKHLRNKFKDWVESLIWDGKPRIATWFQDKFKAYAPPLQDLGLEEEYLAKVSETWFMGGIRRMYTKCQHDVVPVLIGGQGVGKSSGLEYTAGPGDWFAATTINISVPGGVSQFLDSVRGKIVVELAEATTIRSADQEALKAFISKKEDQYRKPYARYEEKFPRHFIMAASTNIANLFTDITGNRRFYPIYCGRMSDREKRECRQKYDAEQVWAEALALYKQSQENKDEKHVWYLSSMWKPAVIMQRYCTQDNLNISTIDEWLDDPKNGYDKIGAKINKNVIFEECFDLDISRPIPKDCAASWKAWVNSTTNWEKFFKRVDGVPARGWQRIHEPGNDFIYDEDSIEEDMCKPKEENYKWTEDEDLMTFVRGFAAKYGLKEMDVIPIDELDIEMIEKMLFGGYIIESRFDKDWRKREYKIVEIP